MKHDEKKIKEILEFASELEYSSCKEDYEETKKTIKKKIKQYAEHLVQQERGRIINIFKDKLYQSEISQKITGYLMVRDGYFNEISKESFDVVAEPKHIINLIQKEQ